MDAKEKAEHAALYRRACAVARQVPETSWFTSGDIERAREYVTRLEATRPTPRAAPKPVPRAVAIAKPAKAPRSPEEIKRLIRAANERIAKLEADAEHRARTQEANAALDARMGAAPVRHDGIEEAPGVLRFGTPRGAAPRRLNPGTLLRGMKGE